MISNRFITKAFRKFGYEITKASQFQRGFRGSHLRRICQPRTVIDVGVARGTPVLYRAFPTAKFILEEPLRDTEDAINEILRKYDGVVYYKALGKSAGVLEINVDPTFVGKSSFKSRTALTERRPRCRRSKSR
jgi:hypothetical protein